MQLLDEALALWRGPAIVQFADRPFALATVARLEELRVAAAERRAQLLLTAGRAEDAVASLQSLLAEHPEREQARGLFMQALYLAGRHTEALSAFRSWRQYLSEELGLDPSPDLRRIEQDILRHSAGPPDLRSEAGRQASALPVPVTSFIGREEDLAGITRLLGQARLLTLHGPGGVGKTRLALEAAVQAAGGYRDGVCFCDLAAVPDPDAVLLALATATGLSERAFEPLNDQLVRQLAGRHLLLILDNCEHVAQAVAILADRLLKQTREVTLLATSRERLEVDGEHVWQVRPLPADGPAAPAVRLFLDRAGAADPAAARNPDMEAVAAVCADLDGLPLAIELAAARLPGTTVSELARNLGDRFGLLTVGRRADSRHRSLRAVVDWSYEQLTDEQQELFRQLAVFHSSFDARILDRQVSELRAARGWLADHDPGRALRMAAQLHWYALWRCHSEVFRWAEASTAAAAGSRSPWYPEALASAAFGAVYRGDLQAASHAASAALDAAQGLAPVASRRPLEALGEVAVFRGELAVAADLYVRAYELSTGHGDARDAAWDAASAAAAYIYGDHRDQASHLVDQARAAAISSGSPSALAFVSWISGEIAANTNPAEARRHLQQAVALAASVDSSFVTGISRVSLATLDARHGDAAVALGHYDRAIREWQQAGAWTPLWVTLRTLVEFLVRVGAWHDAATLYGAVTAAANGAPAFGADADRLRESAALLRNYLTDVEFQSRTEDGKQLESNEVIRFALEAITRATNPQPTT